jgi:hypothetical protein
MLFRHHAEAGPQPGRDLRPERPAVANGAASVTRYGPANLVVVIMLLAGFFDGISGNPVGGALLAAVGVALARSRIEEEGDGAAPRDPVPGPGRRLDRSAWLVVPVLTGYALLAGALPRFSWPATIAVVLPGAAVVAAAGRGRPRRPIPAPRPAGEALWAAVLIAVGVWELINLLLQPSFTAGSWDHPTLSTLADPAFATHAGRSAGLALWLGAGWYLVER